MNGRRRLTLGRALVRYLRAPSPLIMLFSLACLAAARLWLGGYGWPDLAVLAGILLLWPLHEWALHVFVLHARPWRLFGYTIDLRADSGHREHHVRPLDATLAFIAPRVLCTYLVVHMAAWLLLTPSLRLGLTGLVGMAVMGLAYEWVHFLIHTDYKPQTRAFKRLWTSHRLHHFKNEGYWFGVSMLCADRLLGTFPDPSEVPFSSTCGRLFGSGELGAPGNEAR